MNHRLVNDDPVELTAQLIDIPSVSGDEKAIADAVEALLRTHSHLEVMRDGDAVLARTNFGRDQRVLVAGHLDTVPIEDNVPHRFETDGGTEYLWGRGSVDMLGGVAAALHAASRLDQPKYDVTWIFYDHEEVAAELNGLGRIERNHPDWLAADMAILGEPTNARVEGGCNGTIRLRIDFPGVAAHSARSWRGDNAVHKMAPAIARIAAYGNPEIDVDGLAYRESLSVIRIEGGIAGNVVPPTASMWVNYRFAPSRTIDEAIARVRTIVDAPEATFVVDDQAGGARPGLDRPIVADFLDALAGQGAGAGASSGEGAGSNGGQAAAPSDLVGPKYGWTDVARFSALGIPALNYGPGDPLLAHTRDERVPVEHIRQCAAHLVTWLGGHY